MVLEDLAVEPKSRVLEVGFGGSALLENLCRKASGGFVAGLEVSEEMLARGLAEFHRVIRPGGRLVPGFMSADDISRAGLDRHGFSRHSPEELKSALVVAHFRPGSLRSGTDTRGTFYSLAAQRGLTSA
jgi:hypothetical protein